MVRFDGWQAAGGVMIGRKVAAYSAILALWMPGGGVAQEGGDTMRCGSRIVVTGQSLHQVRSLCGDPDSASRRIVHRTLSVPGACSKRHGKIVCDPGADFSVTVEVEDWTYDFGRNQFMRFLTFENGRLVRIDTGSYGFKEPT